MIATTIEQSKHLIELGLDPATSDMYYSCANTLDPYKEEWDNNPKPLGSQWTVNHNYANMIPAWSFDALTKILSDAQNFELHLRIDKTWNLYSKYSTNAVFRSFDINNGEGYKSPIDAAYHLLVWVLENGKFKKKKGSK